MNQPISLEEAVTLGAIDDDFFGSFFFPQTFRQEHPKFSRLVQRAFDDPTSRYVALKMFRGSSKTTRVRVRIAKHISYSLSRTIVLVSNAQKHSIMSLKWLRKQMEYNTRWTMAFGLEKGATWNEESMEIIHRVAGHSVHIIALGITGQIRGVNIDDFRPDFIVLDDPDNEETTATLEQRAKTQDLIFGALSKSLAPPTEAPLSKFAVLQTPLVRDDTIDICSREPNFRTVTISCFDDRMESTWPARFPTKFLLHEKEQHIRMNKLSLWMREMECKIVSPELASFKEEWLRYWEELPDGMDVIIAIDPASSENKNADDQVIGAIGFKKGNVYLLEYTANKGEMPEAAVAYVFHLLDKYPRVRKIAVESISYQRVLAWYLEKHMAENRRWKLVDRVEDKRKKSDRIIQELVDIAANHRLFCRREHTKFISQFVEYSPRAKLHDDVLDMVSIGVMSYKGGNTYDADDYAIIMEDERHIPDLDWVRPAP